MSDDDEPICMPSELAIEELMTQRLLTPLSVASRATPAPPNPKTDFERLADMVGGATHLGVHTVTMGKLRNMVGAKKNGRKVRKEVCRKLKAAGLCHTPLPRNYDEPVLLYIATTRCGVLAALISRDHCEGKDDGIRDLARQQEKHDESSRTIANIKSLLSGP